MIKPRTPIGWPATEAIEEAVSVLRRTPASTVLCAFIGAVPFWLALLYFVADASHSAYAEERLVGASLSLAALYLWKKCWEAVYAAGLRAVLAAEPPEPWTAARAARLVLAQAELQFWGLLVRPLAYNALFPTAWISAYYQNITALGESRPGEAGSLSARAWAQARLWPGQNHALLSIFGFFYLMVWSNVMAFCGAIPMLLKSFLGLETMASRDYGSYFSSTFFLATAALAFLLVDPLWRAAYVVRCYHGASLKSGADIRSGLRLLRARAGALALVALLALGGVAPAAMKTGPPPAVTVDPATLERSIEQTLERREYAWRFRKVEVKEPAKQGMFSDWIKAFRKWFAREWDKSSKWAGKIWRWIQEKMKRPDKRSFESGGHFEIPPIESILYMAGIVAAGLLLWVGWSRWRGPKIKVIKAEAVTVLPDLHSAEVVADQLPGDEWMALARDLASRGELRLALRAVYLAGLAHLGQQQLVSIARHKSNFDYQRELRRRARSREDVLAAFDENLAEFERAWYGDHRVTMPIFEHFTQNLERIRAC